MVGAPRQHQEADVFEGHRSRIDSARAFVARPSLKIPTANYLLRTVYWPPQFLRRFFWTCGHGVNFFWLHWPSARLPELAIWFGGHRLRLVGAMGHQRRA